VRVLLIEDDVEIAEGVRAILERRKFAVQITRDGDAGFEALSHDRFDVAIVDIGLPKRDGFTVARQARAAGIQTPMLMLTARDAVEDRVRGLDAGADDYLVKPFVEEELHARLRALLRRGPMPVRDRFAVGDLVVDSGGRTCEVAGKPIRLAATEFRVLEYLAANAGIVLSRDQILDFVWGTSFDGSRNVVEVYISAIRRKLRAVGAADRLVTVWGVGYKLTG
jgi:two-component system, OmpR family, response regulator QseB